jgi:hypothetical protein
MAGNLLQVSSSVKQPKALAGLLLLATILLAVSHLWFTSLPLSVAGGFAWIAMLLLLSSLRKAQLIQAFVLLFVGLCCLFWALWRGVDFNWQGVLSSNVGLIALLASVSFLRLVTLPKTEEAENPLPVGTSSFIKTVVGTHFFSAVINLSALLIVFDRLSQKQALQGESVAPLSRAFSAAAFWSPFFAAMGVALTYAPGASLITLVLQGLPLAFIALLYSYFEAGDKSTFRGYPLSIASLWVPAVLAVVVLTIHQLKPDYSVVLIVAGAALMLAVLVLFFKQILITDNKQKALTDLKNHTLRELPKMSSELTLFITAGVLAIGVKSLLSSFDNALPIDAFTFSVAVISLLLMVGLALIGVHPVISIAVMGTVLSPLPIDPNILGMLFLSTWALGVVASPFSGMNLALIGRYQLQAKQILGWHFHYLIFMLVVCSLSLWILM